MTGAKKYEEVLDTEEFSVQNGGCIWECFRDINHSKPYTLIDKRHEKEKVALTHETIQTLPSLHIVFYQAKVGGT